MKKVENFKIIECPNCGEMAAVKKNGLLAKIGIGGSIVASLMGSVFATAGVLSIVTLGFIGIGSLIIPAIITFALMFLPMYILIDYLVGYSVECKECGAKYKISTKEFYEKKGKKDPIIKVIIVIAICIFIIAV